MFDLTSSIRKSSGATPLDRSPCTPACLPLKKCAIVEIEAHQEGNKSYAPVSAFNQEHQSCEESLNLKPLPNYFGCTASCFVIRGFRRLFAGRQGQHSGNASLLPFSLSFTYTAIDEHTMTYVLETLTLHICATLFTTLRSC